MDAEHELGELEQRFAFHRLLEVEAEARDLEEARRRAETFRDFLLELPRGLVVGLVTVDGAELWGRIESVGVDKLCLGETAREPQPAARLHPRRLHDVRFDAVVRVVRESDEWSR